MQGNHAVAKYAKRVRSHRLWGTSVDLPDALLLTEPAAYSSIDIGMAEFMLKVRQPGAKTVPVPKMHDSRIAVYRRRGVEAAVRAAETAYGMVLRLQNAFAEPSPARGIRPAFPSQHCLVILVLEYFVSLALTNVSNHLQSHESTFPRERAEYEAFSVFGYQTQREAEVITSQGRGMHCASQ
jgi:hypothetical protein